MVGRRVLAHHGQLLVAGAAAGALAGLAALTLAGDALAALLLCLLGVVAGVVLVAVGVVLGLLRTLPSADFGLCPGPTQPGEDRTGLSDWIAETIEVAAGRMQRGAPPPARPLTFGDLWAGRDGRGSEADPAINLRLMTTNLTLRRPNTLPHLDGNHLYREDEFRRVMPAWIVDHLVGLSEDDGNGYRRLPVGADLPIAVAARMSLSFPFLLAAVPLHRAEFPQAADRQHPPIRRMLFSDGGLSSNFPIHFFDAPLPRRPTFGISLEEFDDRRPDRRVSLPMSARRGIWLGGSDVTTIPAFAMSLINAAKDWQDRLQTTLPGYRERVVSIFLTPDEGGLNLTMPPEVVEALSDLGERAAGLLTGHALSGTDTEPFDFDDHRWRRFLVAFARFEETLEEAARIWGADGDPTSYRAFIEGCLDNPRSFGTSPPAWRRSVFERFDAVMTLAAGWHGTPLREQRGGIPRPRTDMRITPKP